MCLFFGKGPAQVREHQLALSANESLQASHGHAAQPMGVPPEPQKVEAIIVPNSFIAGRSISPDYSCTQPAGGSLPGCRVLQCGQVLAASLP